LRCNKVWIACLKNLDESLLTEIPPFKRLTRPQIREILDKAVPRRVASGQTFFEEGEPASRFMLLLDGHARVIRTTPDGEQVIVLHIVSGQLLGIAAALGRKSYPATAVAADECLALTWPTTQWQDFVTRYDGFATETYKVVGERIGEINNRVVEMATQQVEQRIACALLRLINQTGKKTTNGVEIDFPITRQDISEMTGTTLHTVSRLLSAWEKNDIVASTRRKIVVTNPHQLVLMSGSMA